MFRQVLELKVLNNDIYKCKYKSLQNIGSVMLKTPNSINIVLTSSTFLRPICVHINSRAIKHNDNLSLGQLKPGELKPVLV